MDNNLLRQFKTRDRLVRVLSKEGYFRASALRNTMTAYTAQQRHKLNDITAHYLGLQLAGASLMASFLKGEERIVVDIESDGYIRRLYTEALQAGEVRGFALNSSNGSSLKHEYDLFTNGQLRVTKVLYNKTEPITGIIEMPVGDIAGDIAHYYQQSEQIATAVVLDADTDESGNISYSGGLMVQAMPGAPMKDIELIYERLSDLKGLGKYLGGEYNAEEILKEILPFEFEKVAATQVDFFCRCSKDKFIAKLLTLGIDEIVKMKEEKHNELVCHYCNEHYYLSDWDFDRLIDESLALKN